ncbi:hypothetical protein KM043_015837 [Ampulex compressa]|nr:hypothetical protein KM043_015837 [Ampulex compressa]
MALSGKREGVRYVPWFSPAEWFQVYEQVYSDNVAEQIKAYKTLLSWKVRIPKLPVGVDCTLSILQVCLRDREWTPKIISGELPVHYQNDLSLMYSTTIMRILNHISNIGHTKQTSLFHIARQLNIPEWIVNLRHDAAHGHDLPSIDLLRRAINILLAWLYEEYWAAEANAIEECYANGIAQDEIDESEEIQPFVDLIELWASVSLYSHAGYILVSDIPDPELLYVLQDLRDYAMLCMQQNDDIGSDNEEYTDATKIDINDKSYKLATAQIVLLSEISRYLSKKRTTSKEALILNALFDVETFLPNPDILPIFILRDKLCSIKDLESLHNKEMLQNDDTLKDVSIEKSPLFLADNVIRNRHWTLAIANYNWKQCPIGILPWQDETLNFLEPLERVSFKHNTVTSSGIIPGVIDKSFEVQNRVNWNTVLRKKKRFKKKIEKGDANIINRAIATAKKQK